MDDRKIYEEGDNIRSGLNKLSDKGSASRHAHYKGTPYSDNEVCDSFETKPNIYEFCPDHEQRAKPISVIGKEGLFRYRVYGVC